MSSRSSKLNKILQRGGGSETLLYVGGLFVVIFIIIFIYFKTIGYTVNFGWDKLFFMFEKKQPIDVSVTEDGEVVANATLEPATGSVQAPPPAAAPPSSLGIPDSTPSSANGNLPFSPDERPSGMPGAQKKEEPGLLSGIVSTIEKDIFGKTGGVFNVSRNIYKYEDAAPLCKAMGAELATYDQVLESYKKGGDWCNYGWIKGQMAVFPTQETTWQKLQKGPPSYRFSCGKPGVNGGYFDNPELTFGVNCFGSRPAQNDADDLQNSPEFSMPPTAEQLEFDKKVQKYREGLGNLTVLPFNRGKWSE
jgi:hypothetical protein